MGLVGGKIEKMIPANSDEVIIASSQCHYCYFRPQIFYQKVESWHCTESKLDIKMNFETGENHARFLSDANPDHGDSFLLSQFIENATKIVPDSEEKDDAATITDKLKDAATWGNDEMIGYIIRTCYVTEGCALPALGESCSLGFSECVRRLLDAGVSPGGAVNPAGANALHVACKNGQEECAKLVIQSMIKRGDEAEGTILPDGSSVFELLRNNDMNGMARRLEALINRQPENQSLSDILYREN